MYRCACSVQGKTAELAIVAEREVNYPGNKAKFTLTELNDDVEVAAQGLPKVTDIAELFPLDVFLHISVSSPHATTWQLCSGI